MKKEIITIDQLKAGSVAVLGIPFDAYSSFMRGPALAPQAIRDAFYCPSANTYTENVLHLEAEPRLQDIGDIKVEHFLTDIKDPVTQILQRGATVMSLGGDHSITYPIIAAYAQKYKNLNILHLDAHADLYDIYDGNPYSHACPFARIMEENLAVRLVQIGIRTLPTHELEQARRWGVEIIAMKQWNPSLKLVFDGPLYISLDMDVLDPAFAPGVSHHEPGGLSSREVIQLLQNLDARVVGADIVELNPNRDIMDMTARTAAKFFKEIVGKMLTVT